MGHRLPMSAVQAAQSGLVDAVLGGSAQAFRAQVLQRAAGVGIGRRGSCCVAGQAAAARARRGHQAAGRLPPGGTGAHATQLLWFRSELPHRTFELRPARGTFVDTAPSGDPPT